MKTRGWGLAAAAVVCVAVLSCQKLPQSDRDSGVEQLDTAKLADTIPLDYGNLIAATTNSTNQRWVTLWFERADKSIMIVGVDQRTWKVWTEPRIIGRK